MAPKDRPAGPAAVFTGPLEGGDGMLLARVGRRARRSTTPATRRPSTPPRHRHLVRVARATAPRRRHVGARAGRRRRLRDPDHRAPTRRTPRPSTAPSRSGVAQRERRRRRRARLHLPRRRAPPRRLRVGGRVRAADRRSRAATSRWRCPNAEERRARSRPQGERPERYGVLHHPGDAFAYDIFTQVARALRSPARWILWTGSRSSSCSRSASRSPRSR